MLVLRAVRSTFVTKASNHTIIEASCAVRRAHHGIEHHGARQVVERHVDARLPRIRSWISGSGSVRARSGSRSISTISGTGNPRGAADLARDQLGDERLRSLARTAKLDHVHAFVVGFDDGGHGAAFAQRRDVASDDDGSQ